MRYQIFVQRLIDAFFVEATMWRLAKAIIISWLVGVDSSVVGRVAGAHCVQWMKRPCTLVVLGVHQVHPAVDA
jgi:hypothetical protein